MTEPTTTETPENVPGPLMDQEPDTTLEQAPDLQDLQDEIESLRRQNKQLLKELKESRATASEIQPELQAYAELKQRLAMTDIIKAAEGIAAVPTDIFLAEFGKHFEVRQEGDSLLVYDLEGNPAMVKDGKKERQAVFNRADVASITEPMQARMGALIRGSGASGGGASPSSGVGQSPQEPQKGKKAVKNQPFGLR